jgi:hypothetical protein
MPVEDAGRPDIHAPHHQACSVADLAVRQENVFEGKNRSSARSSVTALHTQRQGSRRTTENGIKKRET